MQVGILNTNVNHLFMEDTDKIRDKSVASSACWSFICLKSRNISLKVRKSKPKQRLAIDMQSIGTNQITQMDLVHNFNRIRMRLHVLQSELFIALLFLSKFSVTEFDLCFGDFGLLELGLRFENSQPEREWSSSNISPWSSPGSPRASWARNVSIENWGNR